MAANLKRDLMQALQNNERPVRQFRENITGRDVVVFLGNTRSGMSTLVNYLMGTELEAFEIRRATFKIRTRRLNNGPEIGQGTVSCTTVPGIYNMANLLLIDSPGFEDSRGIVQDVINGLSLLQIKFARTIKFVLVFSMNEIDADNIGDFMASVRLLEALIVNVAQLHDSVCAIFTKDWRNYDRAEIVQLIRNKVLNVNGLDFNKDLVRYFVNNRGLIGIFRMPTGNGPLGFHLDDNIRGAIDETRAVHLGRYRIKFAISDRAKEALLHLYTEYTDTNYFDEEVNRITNEYSNYFYVDKYVYASYDNELDATKRSLSTIMSCILAEVHKRREHLKQIEPSLQQLLQSGVSRAFRNHFMFITVLDTNSILDEAHKVTIIGNYRQSLLQHRCKVDRLIDKINDEMSERNRNSIQFVNCGVLGLSGGVVVGSGLVLGSLAFIGGAALVAIAGTAAAIIHHERYGKRIEERRNQHRPE